MFFQNTLFGLLRDESRNFFLQIFGLGSYKASFIVA
nr:MAG TPA: hypothetical protein [Caudoviricetes sp.]